MTPAELRQLRDDLRAEQAALKRRLANLRTALAGIDGLLGDDEAASPPPPSPELTAPRGRPARPSTRRIPASEYALLAERVRNGEMLERIAADYGVTRERVRQVAEAVAPGAGACGRAVRRALRIEQRGIHAEVRGVVTALRTGPCLVCTGPVTRERSGNAGGHGVKRGRTCSPRCRQLWDVCRFHLDDDARATHALAAARWQLAHDPRPFQQRYAERVVAGEAPLRSWTARSATVEGALAEVAELRNAVAASGESWWT